MKIGLSDEISGGLFYGLLATADELIISSIIFHEGNPQCEQAVYDGRHGMAAIAYNLKKYLKYEKKVNQPQRGELKATLKAIKATVFGLFSAVKWKITFKTDFSPNFQ